ncbi:hypothetical protein BGZ76_005899 [Entomortierella beljakovae]|nr:hypothetical protein BGZ76_005899 [Entomortierella beljakovae]
MARPRKSADSLAYSVLYYVFLAGAVVTLIYYAYNRVDAVIQRNYFVQSKYFYHTEESTVTVPNVVLCMTNAEFKPLDTPPNWDYKIYNLQDPSLPTGFRYDTPCSTRGSAPHTHAYIFFTIHERLPSHHDMTKFMFPVTPNNTGLTGVVHIIPQQNNPYMNASIVPNDSRNLHPELTTNNFFFYQGQSITRITPELITTRTLRTDFRGLFGVYNETGTSYAVASRGTTSYVFNFTGVGMTFPSRETLGEEVLVVSAPVAISSWGGAFSLIVSIFFLLFGDRPFSPFGIIQKYIMKSSTKKKIATVVEKKDADEENPLTSLDDDPTLNADLTKAPLPFVLGNANAQAGYAQNPDVAKLQFQQQQIHHDELVSLRQQVQALKKGLKRAQGNDVRINHIETLLREFYFDMDLVQTEITENSSDTKTASSTSYSPVKSDTNLVSQDLRNRKDGWTAQNSYPSPQNDSNAQNNFNTQNILPTQNVVNTQNSFNAHHGYPSPQNAYTEPNQSPYKGFP